MIRKKAKNLSLIVCHVLQSQDSRMNAFYPSLWDPTTSLKNGKESRSGDCFAKWIESLSASSKCENSSNNSDTYFIKVILWKGKVLTFWAVFFTIKLKFYFTSCFIATSVTKESAFSAAVHSEGITLILKYAGCSKCRYYCQTGLLVFSWLISLKLQYFR